MELYEDKNNIGIGSWFVIHTMAFYCKDKKSKENFIQLMKTMKLVFPCHYCREHMTNFMKEEPLKNYEKKKYKDNYNVGYFYWTWKLHNEVNKRLKKKTISFHEAYEFFSNLEQNVCYNCGDINKNEEKVTSINPEIAFKRIFS